MSAKWYTIRAYKPDGEWIQFSSTRKAQIERCWARWQSEGLTGIHYR